MNVTPTTRPHRRRDPHTARITIAMTEAMFDDLTAAAEASGYSVAWLIREQLKILYGRRDGGPAPAPVNGMPRPRGV